MKLRILHCILDEKFIDSMISVMDMTEDRCENDYVIVSERNDFKFNFIKKTSKVHILSSNEFIPYLDRKHIDVIVVHSMFSLNPDLIIKIKKEIKIVWLAWGYDIYEPILNYRSLIKTRGLYHFRTKVVKNLEYYMHPRKIIDEIKHFFDKSYFEDAIRRMDFFSGVIPDEFGLIANDCRNGFFKAKSLDYSYFNLESNVCEKHLDDPYINGQNIQVGNSGDETNNHLDVLALLKKYNIRDKKVFLPISYSGSDFYKSVVRWYGKYLWKDNFVPIEKFMPLDDYLKVINTTQYAIFYHERQQAMGNITNALWNGCMVFVSKYSPVYSYLRKCGYVVFTVQDDLYRIEKDEILSYEDRINNRKILIEHNSPQVCMAKIDSIIDILKEDCKK